MATNLIIFRLVLFLLFAGIPARVFASLNEVTHILESSKGVQSAAEYPDYIRDPQGTYTLEEVLQKSWQRYEKKIAGFGWTSDVVWISTSYLKKDHAEYILEIGYPLLDSVDLYIFKEARLIQHLRFGDRVLEKASLIDELDPALEIPSDPGLYRLVFRISSGSSVQLPVKIYETKSFYKKESEEFFTTGGFVGILLIMAVYNSFIYLASRNLTYLYYCLFVTSFLLLQVCLSGHASFYLWPQNPHWTDGVLVTSGLTSSIFQMLFANQYLGLKKSGKKRKIYLRSILFFQISCLFLSPFLPYQVAVEAMAASSILSAFSTFSIAFYQLMKGQREAKFYCGAWVAMVLGGLFYIGKQFGIFPVNLFTNHAFKIASIIEIALLSLALADQMAELRRKLSHSLKDQIAHLKLQEQVAHDHEIHERSLRFQSELRLNLASSVAHRINNPLNYIHLGVDGVRDVTSRVEKKLKVIFGDDISEDPDVRQLQESFQTAMKHMYENISLIDAGVDKASLTVNEVKVLSGIEKPKLDFLGLSEIWEATLERLREILSAEKFGYIDVTYEKEDSENRVLSNIFIIKCALEMFVLKILENETGTVHFSNREPHDGGWQVSCRADHVYSQAFIQSLQANLDNILRLGYLAAEVSEDDGGILIHLHPIRLDSPAQETSEGDRISIREAG